ncbi:uncharacterized protein LOC130674879 [Microplitis mediator]|uniref:uncharacterized protein LOC130674879 n=1 Tax=Microplitis mediator TaxID=375433 RepID=UPI002553A06B|nr:uncharacterized protein LOC130674879 [Microplitis mediator]
MHSDKYHDAADLNVDHYVSLKETCNSVEVDFKQESNNEQQLMIQEELELDYEVDQNNSFVEEKDDEEDNVTVTINNKTKENSSAVAYVFNEADNTYNVTNYEIEIKNRIILNRLQARAEDSYLNSILGEYRDLKQQYYFLKNIPITERINVPIFYDYQSERVKRIIVVPHIILKSSIFEVIYNLINTSWLIKPKPRAFKISSDYINKYIEQINSSKLFKSSISLQLCRGYVALLSTSYFKIGRAKCLAGLTVAIFAINSTNDVELIDFVTANHVNIQNFYHNEDQLRKILDKYNIIKIFCWLPNYGTVHNTLYGNVYWFNDIIIDIHNNRRLYNLYDKISMEKNFDTTTLCVNSIKHSERCSYCNMMRLAIKIFNPDELRNSPMTPNMLKRVYSKNKVQEYVSYNTQNNLYRSTNEKFNKYCKPILRTTPLAAATRLGVFPPYSSEICKQYNRKLAGIKCLHSECRGRNRSKSFNTEVAVEDTGLTRSHSYQPYLLYKKKYHYTHKIHNQ